MHCGYKDLKDAAMSQRGSQSNKGTEEQTIAKARDRGCNADGRKRLEPGLGEGHAGRRCWAAEVLRTKSRIKRKWEWMLSSPWLCISREGDHNSCSNRFHFFSILLTQDLLRARSHAQQTFLR